MADQLDPDIAAFLKAQGRVILSFSGGKDSLACWCLLAELGIEVRAFYMHLIPGMSFIEKYLDYVGAHFSTHIMRVAHPLTYHYLRTYTGQPPHRKDAIDFLRLPHFEYEDVEKGVRRTLNQREPGKDWDAAWIAVGTKMTDNPIRRYRFKQLGWKRPKLLKLYPAHNVGKADLIAIIKRHGVKLSPCYRMYGRSFEGIDYRYIDAIKTDYPEDYQRILDWFPLMESEFYRVKFAVKHGIATVT